MRRFLNSEKVKVSSLILSDILMLLLIIARIADTPAIVAQIFLPTGSSQRAQPAIADVDTETPTNILLITPKSRHRFIKCSEQFSSYSEL